MNCPHCSIEYNLTDRVPKITQCDKIVCLACLKNAQKSSNNLNYVCHFHLSEHQIPQNGGFESLPEAINIKKKIEINECKMRLVAFEEERKRIEKIKAEIDLRVQEVINSVKEIQAEMYKKLGVDESTTENVWLKINDCDSNLEEINSNPSSQRLQELNHKIDDNLKCIKNVFSTSGHILKSGSNVKFEKSDKSFTFDDLIGTVGNFEDSTVQLSDSKWKLKFDKTIKHEKFQLIMSMCEFKVNKHLVITDQLGKCLHRFDSSSLEYIESKMDYKIGHLSGICQLEDEQQLCLIDKQTYCLYLIDKNYKIFKSKSLETTKSGKIRSYLDIDYGNGKFYLWDSSTMSILVFDKELNLVSDVHLSVVQAGIQSMRIINKQICISDWAQRRIHIFDTKLNHLCSFGDEMLKNPADFLFFSEHIYVFEFHRKYIKMFDAKTYKSVFEIKIEHDKAFKAVVIGRRLIINSSNSELLVYEILN